MTKQNIGNTWLGKSLTILALFSLLWFPACNNDEEPVAPVQVEFATTEVVVGEQAGPQTITLSLDKAAKKNGTVKLSASEGASAFANFPTTVQIVEGNTAVQFTVTPINNAILDAARVITFTISEPSNGFEIGENTSLVFNITDDESPAQANFAANSSNTNEDNATGVDVTINISAPAPGSGNLTINITSENATYATHYTTVPAAVNNVITVPVAQAQTSVTFKIIPVNNADVNAARVVNFTIATSTTNAVTVGTIMPTHAFTINDDEQPSTITFTSASSSVSEATSEGQTVSLTLDPQTIGTGSVTISIASDNATYGTHFTTDPAATNGSLTVAIGSGVTSASFKVIPVNNTEETANRVITFTTSASTGIVVLGASNNTHQITITEDDIPTTIAAVRALFQGSQTTITDDIFIVGVITSSNSNVTSRNAFIQDATGAIQLRFAANNTLVRGDEVKVSLKDVILGLNSGLLQLGGTNGMPNANATKIGDGVLPAYEVITVTQLNSGSYESKLVKVEGVGFYDANGTNNLRYNSGTGAGNNIFGNTNGVNSVLRVESYAPFNADVIPYGTGTLQGIASVFNTTWQIIPMEAADIFTSTETATLSTSLTSLDFGDVNKDASATLTFTVSGTSLVGDVLVTAPSSYTVSLNGTDFSSSVTIPSASANGGPVTVTAKFSPVSGSNQTIAGTVTLKSLGAAGKTVSVTGNEIGNAATPGTLMIYEVYGGGGNSGATFTHDYVVLYNGTSQAIDLVNYSLQYASATSTTTISNIATLSGVINAGDYFLIQLAGGATGVALPTPDLVASPALNLSGTAGKIVLVSGSVGILSTAVTDPTVVDYVGFGTTANAYEGTGRAPAPSNSTSIKRKSFIDSNDNSIDFEVVSPPNLSYLN